MFFTQLRTGLNGRTFTLYKFRSMYRDAEARRAALASRNEMSGPVFKIKDDPRITPVGKWMRLDLAYIDTWSLRLDVQILLRTVPVVLTARGAH